MRVTSDLWVSALLKRVFGTGGFAAVLRRGATEAGAIFIITRSRLGTVTLYGPAPQTSYGEAGPAGRIFAGLMVEAEDEAVAQRLERERKFDPDIWVVEIEADAAFDPPLFEVSPDQA
jgi:hypothetical protein